MDNIIIIPSVWLGAVRRSVQVRLCTSGCKSEKMFGVIIIIIKTIIKILHLQPGLLSNGDIFNRPSFHLKKFVIRSWQLQPCDGASRMLREWRGRHCACGSGVRSICCSCYGPTRSTADECGINNEEDKMSVYLRYNFSLVEVSSNRLLRIKSLSALWPTLVFLVKVRTRAVLRNFFVQCKAWKSRNKCRKTEWSRSGMLPICFCAR